MVIITTLLNHRNFFMSYYYYFTVVLHVLKIASILLVRPVEIVGGVGIKPPRPTGPTKKISTENGRAAFHDWVDGTAPRASGFPRHSWRRSCQSFVRARSSR